MHRSGTSCLAGCLQEAGLEMGEVIEAAPHNRKGNREHRMVRGLNDEVLAHSGGSWRRPPARLQWHGGHREQRDGLLRRHSHLKQWGFKDPRTTLTLPFWREGSPDIRLVGTFRHPMSVARSLARRDGIWISEAVELWTMYNRRMLEYHRELPFPIVSFDLAGDDYRAAVRAAGKTLGFKMDPEGPRFVESILVHQKASGEDGLGPETLSIYRELQSAAESAKQMDIP